MTSQTVDKTSFKFPGQSGFRRGKVRDVYDLGDSLLLLATDRYSAFDRNLALVPYKGQLVTAISRWWFDQTSSIVKNHVKGFPDPNATWAYKYKVLPLEVVVRGYITGVTNTSLWHNYGQGQRDFGSFSLPDGLRKNQLLPNPVLTPTTKFEGHDRALTPEELISENFVNQKVWQQVQDIALKLFKFGQDAAKKKGLILVDTKYEFGQDNKGKVVLVDEIHTPDSSRYWQAEDYKQKFKNAQEPDNYDKEFLRLWFKERCDPYKDKILPKPPQEIIDELSNRYIYVYERLSGKKFVKTGNRSLKQMETNIKRALGKS